MRKPSRLLSALIIAGFVGNTIPINAQETDDSDLAEILAAERNQLPSDLDPSSVQTYLDGIAAYIYGYSLLAIAMTERVSTDIASAGLKTGRAPINQLYRATSLPVGSAFKDVVLPSTTTMYSVGFFNLEEEPLILHIPVIGDNRFFIVQLLDGWTNVNRASPSSRVGSKAPGDYALVGPGWSGELPDTLAGTIRFDTNTVWQIMRVYTTGTKEDQDLVAEILNQLRLKPLSKYEKPYTPPENLPVNPSIDTVTQPIKQVASLDACTFFGTMSAMMMTNPPRKIDAHMVPRLERLGIIGTSGDQPTQFSCANLTGTQEGQAADKRK
jgi:hypothetical protein